ncbi:efflux RND transporter periplasmic adaptor subunit [Fulvivirgaceae bacterium BMA12]|uniref:Efflux RND transporter periplasmic adaptor subunit n=1 Tax=Agaribacillus aureus TaxID=3051825 RepID=A0ABT8LG54_9BACT|nr:efflux RND transporter periplasmic adaptor subunit [Fulvivirgaceae bacterium BMA12]
MQKKIFIAAGLAMVLLLLYFFVWGRSTEGDENIIITAKRGDFQIDITTTGELEAKNATRVQGPAGLRVAHMYSVKIEDMVDEGTKVKKGDYIARLDRSELLDKIQNENNDLQQSLSKYTQTKLDTALDLRAARDELINLKFDVEEKEIVLSQSQFEPPATIKQAEINLEKAKRTHKQAIENYQLKSNKAVAQMQEAAARLADDQSRFDFLNKLLSGFKILAPEDGMVIYKRSRGSKVSVGSTISPWDPTVATLPDLSTMISTTYINEVDIRVVKKGQKVNIGLDAYPDKKLTGSVISVANIGEQKPNSDAKVFQVKVEINQADTTLLPAMTTSNTIIAEVIPDKIYIPLECLHSQGDSVSYVIRKTGIDFIKQQVEFGKSNANDIVIERGVKEGDKLYLSIPEGIADAEVRYLTDELVADN